MTSPAIRSLGKWLAIGTVLIAIFVTQWPFRYQITTYAIGRRWSRIDWSWYHGVDRDFVLNVLMLVPLGVGYALWRQAGRVRVLLESLVVGTVTTVVLELAQLLTPWRYTSFLDVWHNAAGCVAGCAFVLVATRIQHAE